MSFPTSYTPDVQQSIEKALQLLDIYLESFNWRRADKMTATLEFPLLLPTFGPGVIAPLTREVYGDTERKGWFVMGGRMERELEPDAFLLQ